MEQNPEVLTSISQQGGGDSDESWDDQSSEIPTQPQKKKRGKISSNACNKCKRDKKKCDGNYATESPCTYCLDHNEKCTYPEPGRRRPRNNIDTENQSRVEDTLISLTRFFNNLTQVNQVNSIFKDQLFQLFVHPSTTIDQFLLLKRLWNEMNNDLNGSRFSVDNLNSLFIILTILIQNREGTIQLYFWERIRQVVEGANDIQEMIPTTTPIPVIHPSIFPYVNSDQNISETTAAVVPSQSQSLSDFLHDPTTVQFNDNSGNVQQSSTSQDNHDHIQFINSLIELAESNRGQIQDSQKQEAEKQEQTKSSSTSSTSTQIVHEKPQELEKNSKQSKVTKPTENRVKKRRASTQTNESTGSTRVNKQRKKQSPYLDHVHIMYRPVKPDSKTSLVFHKEDPIDNSIVFENTFQAKNQYTSTIPTQSQYQQQQQQQMPLSFEQWNSGSTNLFSNQPISQSTTSPKPLTREQTPQSGTLFSHPEPLPYYMDSPVNDHSIETRHHTDSADIDLILGISQISEQL